MRESLLMITEKNIGAVIVAAGFSSRAKAFKPLLPLESSTLIETAVQTFHGVGITDIVVVTGYQAETLENHIAYTGAVFLRSDYLRNRMFDSACIGLRRMKNKCDMVFFTPADSPLFTKYTLKAMISEMRASDIAVICPCYNQRKGHPLLIRCNSLDDLLCHDGTDGMKGALDRLNGVQTINLPDPAIIMDADTPEEYEIMKLYARERAVPSDETCMKLHEFLKTPGKIQTHCKKVAWAAEKLALALAENGHCLDLNKIRSAALLHDIAGADRHHAVRGAALLEDLGYTGIAPLVTAHEELDEDNVSRITEKTVVFFADKRIDEESIVSIKDRFGKKMDIYRNDRNAYHAVQRKFMQALQVENTLNRLLPDYESLFMTL